MTHLSCLQMNAQTQLEESRMKMLRGMREQRGIISCGVHLEQHIKAKHVKHVSALCFAICVYRRVTHCSSDHAPQVALGGT